jgi:hypothetical protein
MDGLGELERVVVVCRRKPCACWASTRRRAERIAEPAGTRGVTGFLSGVVQRHLFGARLSDCVGAVKEEDRDLLVRLLADIDSAVNPFGRLIPIRLPRRDLESMALATIAVLDCEGIAAQDNRYPMKWIAVPGHRLAGCEA